MDLLENQNLQLRDTLNPYRQAALLIKNRLKWDFNKLSWDSRKKLQAVKNKYQGQKAIIICNGPSLNKVDFQQLDGVFTFGLNKINLLFDRGNFRPSAIVAVNSMVIEQNYDFFNDTQIPLYIDEKGAYLVKNRKNVTFLHSSPVKTFAKDCSLSVNQGGTVTYVALQLAFHYGFSKVGLIGCDHYFKDKGPANALAVFNGQDDNHFDKNYFASGQKWHLPDLPQNEYSYSMANEVYSNYGRQIYNCTAGGHLDLFDRLPLEDFLKI
ncbi:6-hydroxymethylpterin diphosphokinase MptE-like protein [Spirosoma pollinicola]|uniref:6-hydroxymethylpterin diphosphokinase MptE-like domain-containing protein n=1 Tax=Spirosoma pollinicola TaxID=2057025 RepID=A0A2K8Z3M0_9BACT|nr:6-hydroxymethylpterin diphosphokinase MptE-like protein [Spirosoma pollinicola]AUD04465.1 hypothetical protein CWM47_23035 [Spirosoma pollinicola]